jgi:hypothetical protein
MYLGSVSIVSRIIVDGSVLLTVFKLIQVVDEYILLNIVDRLRMTVGDVSCSLLPNNSSMVGSTLTLALLDILASLDGVESAIAVCSGTQELADHLSSQVEQIFQSLDDVIMVRV